jgi:hypothetical protein
MRPYLRAYMAGITVPTIVAPFIIAALALQHTSAHPFHIEDVLIFPVGLVPNAWGLWNMLFLRVRASRELPAGLAGAALVLVLAPAGYFVQLAVGKMIWTPTLFAIGFPVALVGYYLAWKYFVAGLNDMLGVG